MVRFLGKLLRRLLVGVEQAIWNIERVERIPRCLSDARRRLRQEKRTRRRVHRPRCQSPQIIGFLKAEIGLAQQRRRGDLAQTIAGEPFVILARCHDEGDAGPVIGLVAMTRVPADQGCPQTVAYGDAPGERWPGKTEQRDEWIFCLTAVKCAA